MPMADAYALRGSEFFGEERTAPRNRGDQTRAWGIILLLAGAMALLVVANLRSAQVADKPEEPEEIVADKHPEVERRVLELLSAGYQANAEYYLQEQIARFPQALRLTELLAANKRSEAETYMQANSPTIQEAQRILFLSAACTRSRFDKQTALRFFQTVSTLNPRTASGKCANCIVLLDSGAMFWQVEELFNRLTKLVNSHPDDLMLRWMLAVQCRTWNRNADGALYYKQILKKWNPGPSLAHQTYANLLDELGRYNEALPERYKAVRLEPAPWSYHGLANTLNSLGRFAEAAKARAIAANLEAPGR